MCKLYKEKCSDDNIKSYWLRYLQKEFQKMSLAKYKPKKDQCKTYVAFLKKHLTMKRKKSTKHIYRKKRCIQVEGQNQTGSKKRS